MLSGLCQTTVWFTTNFFHIFFFSVSSPAIIPSVTYCPAVVTTSNTLNTNYSSQSSMFEDEDIDIISNSNTHNHNHNNNSNITFNSLQICEWDKFTNLWL